MKVNVNNLKNEISALNKLLDDYEENYLNYYNVLSSFSFYWNDARSKIFFASLPKEKMQCANLLDELKDLKGVYSYIADKYSALGNKISANLNARNKVLRYFNNYIDKLDRIINRFDYLDLSFCSTGIYNSIRNRRNELSNMRERAKTARNKVDNIFDKIDRIETEIKKKIRRVNVSVIRETDISGMY